MTTRILYVLGIFPELSQTFVINQMAAFTALGADISVNAGTINQENLGLLETGNRDLMDRVTCRGPILGRYVASQPGNLLRRATRQVVNATAAPLMRRWRKPDRYDVILCHFGPNGLGALSLEDLGYIDGPLAVHFHGYDMSMTLQEHGPMVYRRLFEEGRLMLPVSDLWAQKLVDMGCPREKILVQRMGIDPARFRFQPRARGDVFHFAAIGRFTEKKGFEYLIEAAGKLREAGAAPFRVTIAGDGQLRPGVMARATEAGLANIVSFPGPLHQDEVVALLSTADAFVAPSVTAANGDMEGIPVALMEAMASGLPVISTRHSGIPELIKDGVSGLLADERDAAGLADAMARIMADERLTRSLVDAARAGIERDYDASRLNKDLFKRLTALSQDPNP